MTESDPLPSDDEPTRDLRPSRWRRLEDLFHQASELPPADRGAFLEEACAGDAELRREIEELIAASDSSEEHISSAIRGTFELAAEDDEGLPLRAKIGPYRVIEEIGRGGMSTVYLAERADEHFRKRVAVKVVKRGMDTREILQRLRQERQILAHLEHPNIAKLLDGGNTDDGLPYFVMEHVEGEPVDVYCDRHGLSVRRRLELFLDICAAVQHAHRSLVVHRDLKPSNILVTAEGAPKLLDFGIAKLLDPTLAPELPVPTATGVRLLTPEYASPEQIRGEPLTTATDTYSLGVLLYGLLTGHHPYSLDRRQQRELERAICEEEPERPSLVVHREPTFEATTAQLAAAREVSPDRLSRQLGGDLDNILLMALRKEPGRRYASVEQLAGDLRRHLEGLPVRARPDTLAYRAQKFFLRHRVAVVAAASVVLLSGAQVTFYTARLTAERDRARLEERKSSQVASFLRSFFEGIDPRLARGRELTARELLKEGFERSDELSEHPEVEADLTDLIGTVYLSLGDHEKGGALIEKALEQRRAFFGAEHSQVALSQRHYGEWLHAAGRYGEAEEALRAALDMRRRIEPGSAPEAEDLTALAEHLYQKDEFGEAAELFEEALALRLRLFGPKGAEVADSYNAMGVVAYTEDEHARAKELLETALAIRLEIHRGVNHPDIAATMSGLAAVHGALGDTERAKELYREVLAIRRQLYGPEHPRVADTLNNLGELLRRKGDYAGAARVLRESLEMIEAWQGKEHPSYAASLENLADALQRSGDLAAAEPLHLQALDITRRTLGSEHGKVSWILMRLGDCVREARRLREAEKHYREALVLRRGEEPVVGRRVANAAIRLGSVLLEIGHVEQAEMILRHTDESLAEEPESWQAGAAKSWLGATLRARGQKTEAASLLREGTQILTAALGGEHELTRAAVERERAGSAGHVK